MKNMTHMKRLVGSCAAVASAILLLSGLAATAAEVKIYVDAAPNVYGSPAYAPWQVAAFAAAASGSFVNMAGTVNPCNVGTTDFEIEDEVVYSFGDLGKRLTWVYWIPGETKASLAGRLQVAGFNVWDGDVWDMYGGWVTPTKLTDYDADGDGNTDGVVGIAGMAWWGAYLVDTPEALEADLTEWGQARESYQYMVKLDGQVTSITCNRLPVRVTELFGDCAAGVKNHGQFVKCVSSQLQALAKSGVITGDEKGKIQGCAAQTKIGK